MIRIGVRSIDAYKQTPASVMIRLYLECGVGHGLVVFADGRLVVVLGGFDQTHHLLGRLRLRLHGNIAGHRDGQASKRGNSTGDVQQLKYGLRNGKPVNIYNQTNTPAYTMLADVCTSKPVQK